MMLLTMTFLILIQNKTWTFVIFTKCMILLTIITMIVMEKKNMDIYNLYKMYDPPDYDFYDPNAK